MNKPTYIIASCGVFTLIVSWVQWFFRFPDTSQLVLGTSIGIVFLAFAYIYWWMKLVDKRIETLNKRVDGIVKMYTKGEWE